MMLLEGFQIAEVWFFINILRTKMQFRGQYDSGVLALDIELGSVGLVCPPLDCTALSKKVMTEFDQSQKDRSVLVQFVTEESELMGVCFFSEQESSRAPFVEALTHIVSVTKSTADQLATVRN